MDKRRSQKTIISTGTTSIVLIFVMLSMLTFSVLSLASAQADLRLSRKSAQRTADYYAAENAANDVLLALMDAAEDGPEALADCAAAADVTVTDGAYAYQVPLGEEQILAVEAALEDDGGCRILSWRVESRYDWNADDTLNLLGTSGLPAGMEDMP